MLSGGGQERGMRSGTLPTPLIVGLGEACAIAKREYDYEHVSKLAKRLLDGINSKLQNAVRNVIRKARRHLRTNFCGPGICGPDLRTRHLRIVSGFFADPIFADCNGQSANLPQERNLF
jgi:cysteine sulfinate desulfinase/cysteine desulfurase-like protein